jgi:hypothetical protein
MGPLRRCLGGRPYLIERDRQIPGLGILQQVASVFTEQDFWRTGCLPWRNTGCDGAVGRNHAALTRPTWFDDGIEKLPLLTVPGRLPRYSMRANICTSAEAQTCGLGELAGFQDLYVIGIFSNGSLGSAHKHGRAGRFSLRRKALAALDLG